MSGVPLQAALSPNSVAVIGGSDQPAKPGGRPTGFLKQYGFAGAIYPVNPGRDRVQGLQSFPRIAEIPTKIGLAEIALAAKGQKADDSGDSPSVALSGSSGSPVSGLRQSSHFLTGLALGKCCEKRGVRGPAATALS
ncbi:CoA-binding protein [Bradyrhizobium viridifuturi]|uniref:CoA-binding protein n=1 Tax=uncultured Bradyrhizobium sp. TaxID=199684 RepID=UPI001BA464AA|nr:CoA-binding protein [uncultured Bradyrhizobium sp.]MBR1040660.1 CoA-binding protein [Bradyrhizobium viridifuturi]MBR1074948.1 CoA-binding protein [Bradyrhizobium viridifuturi]